MKCAEFKVLGMTAEQVASVAEATTLRAETAAWARRIAELLQPLTAAERDALVQGGSSNAPPPGAVGDVNSDAKGSGARYNTGKPDLALIPLDLLSQSVVDGTLRTALVQLGQFQRTHDVTFLHGALRVLGADGWEEAAHVFAYGAGKYAPWNWAKGMAWSIPLACAARHLLAMHSGQHLDPESNLPHRGHVFCNVIMLLQYAKTYTEGNDLPPKGLL